MGGAAGFGLGMELGASNETRQGNTPETTTTITGAEVVGRFVVREVTDGDTVKVSSTDNETIVATIRILGINAPESRPNQGRPVQCYARQASEQASRLLLDKTVELAVDAEADSVDSNGRLLRKIDMDPGPEVEDFSRTMVRNGFAAAYRRYRSSDRGTLIQMEEDARSERRGLWGECRIPGDDVPANLSTEVTFPPA